LRRTRQTFESLELTPRVLQDVSKVDVSTSILGARQSLPLILAPTGYTRMMHHEGERAVVKAAARAGIPYTLSTMGTTSLEDVASTAPTARRWFQLYLWRDRQASIDFVERAQATGYDTLVLTVDTPVGGRRLRDMRNGLTIPPKLRMKTVLDGALHPNWWINFLTTEPLQFASLQSFEGTAAELADHLFDPSSTIEDVSWLRGIWPGKLVVKGVQCAEDALLVVDSGADAVVISNHGGRQLDLSPTPLSNLPSVVAAVGDRAEVFIDGGVMTGSDIVAAVAMGARGVLIGRAYLYGLMAGGEAGVDRVLEILRDETVNTVQLLGASRIDELNPSHVNLNEGVRRG
jgi:L-lactate dehydrogenase (cytochrome)